eukprot:scaffold2159_cov170-Pinguiococcus_pyrenoidosus.AAC.1
MFDDADQLRNAHQLRNADLTSLAELEEALNELNPDVLLDQRERLAARVQASLNTFTAQECFRGLRAEFLYQNVAIGDTAVGKDKVMSTILNLQLSNAGAEVTSRRPESVTVCSVDGLANGDIEFDLQWGGDTHTERGNEDTMLESLIAIRRGYHNSLAAGNRFEAEPCMSEHGFC